MFINQGDRAKLKSIAVCMKKGRSISQIRQQRFELVNAAGGIVSKENRILMIHRLGKWDLPKGKINKEESPTEAAVREVEEECNIRVKLVKKVCTTWHTYHENQTEVWKKTTWYAMTCADDIDMKPETEEGIDEVAWMGEDELHKALRSSYPSIRYVFQEYYKHLS